MKEITLAFLLVLITASYALSQRIISGTVKDSNDEPLIGASVLVKSTTNGATTDLDGNYSINVPDGSTTLVISYTGYDTQELEIGVSNTLNITLFEATTLLNEIVVTALGIEREKKELGYAVTTVDGDDVAKARSANVLESLSGRVPGLRINSSSGTAGGAVNIQIRGASSLAAISAGGSNGPLFVVDGNPISNNSFNGTRSEVINGGADIGSRASDISADDIESISVLKGASAVALYGQRARDGVILIKTKRAKEGKIAVDVNSSVRLSSPLRLPDFQNEYASGNFGQYDADAFVNGWGPKISEVQGQNFRQFPFTEDRPLTAQPDNVKDFFETGTTFVNNVAVSTRGKSGDFRVSYTYVDEKSFIPGNRLKRNSISLNGGTSFTEKLRARAVINYARTEGFNRPRQGSNSPSILLSSVYVIPRTLDVEELKNNLVDENGATIGLDGNSTTNNPYYIVENNPFNNTVDRIFGNVELNYDILPWLNVVGRVGTDVFTDSRRNITSKGTLGAITGQYEDRSIYRRELNTDVILTARKDLSESISGTFLVGWNTNEIYFEHSRLVAADLVAADVYNPANALSTNNQRNETLRRLIGGYFDIGLAYNDYLFLNITGRNDKSSTLPKDNNSYFYPGISTSFIFSDAFNLDGDVLSYGKLRGSFAQVGSDEAPYQLDFLFTPSPDIFTQFVPNNTYPIGGQSVFEGPLTLPAGQSLEPQKQNTFEIGTELQFFNGRIGVDFTYYNSVTSNQILSIAVPQSTGFESIRKNVGEVKNVGYEALLNVTPVKTNDISWDIFFNFSTNNQEVVELADGLEELALTSGFSGLSIRAEPGEPFGLYGSAWARTDNGDIIIDEATGLRRGGDRERLGNILPDYQLGIGTGFSYKNLSVSALVDISVGGVMFSRTISSLRGNGLAEETLENRGQIFIDEGVVEVGPDEYVTNTVPVRSMQDFWNNYTNNSNTEGSVFDADYAKLREVTIGYQLPKSLIKDSFIQSLTIGIEARNLLLLHSKVPHIDPEASFFGPSLAGGGANVEFWSVPSARSLGFNLKARF